MSLSKTYLKNQLEIFLDTLPKTRYTKEAQDLLEAIQNLIGTKFSDIPPEILSLIASKLNSRSTKALALVSTNIQIDDKNFKLRHNKTLIKIHDLIQIILDEIDKMPPYVVGEDGEVGIEEHHVLATFELVEFAIVRNACIIRRTNKAGQFVIDTSSKDREPKRLSVNKEGLINHLLSMFAIADKGGFDVTELFKENKIYICGGDNRVSPKFPLPSNENILKINIGVWDPATEDPGNGSIQKEDIYETIKRTQLMCKNLKTNGLISYETLHEDPSSYIIPNSEHQTKNVKLCKPWTDDLIPNVVIPKIILDPYPGSTKAAILLAVGKGAKGAKDYIDFLKQMLEFRRIRMNAPINPVQPLLIS
jgi:hypothetical protein